LICITAHVEAVKRAVRAVGAKRQEADDLFTRATLELNTRRPLATTLAAVCHARV